MIRHIWKKLLERVIKVYRLYERVHRLMKLTEIETEIKDQLLDFIVTVTQAYPEQTIWFYMNHILTIPELRGFVTQKTRLVELTDRLLMELIEEYPNPNRLLALAACEEQDRLFLMANIIYFCREMSFYNYSVSS
jgi:hypothetical protein